MKDNITIVSAEQVTEFFAKRSNCRLARSKKYTEGQRVTPIDTPRKEKEYIFVSSIRWSCGVFWTIDCGGYMLLNPRTNKLISVTNITPLE